MDTVPLVIFVYNRPKETLDLLKSIDSSDIGSRNVVIIQDGLKENSSNEGESKWINVQSVINNWKYPQKTIIVRQKNIGLAQSVYQGINEIFKNSDRVIVLEDDLIIANDFFSYIDEALALYAKSDNISSISGYVHNNNLKIKGGDVFLFPRVGSWGWATWRDRWEGFELDAIDKSILRDKAKLKSFNKGGIDLSWMLRNQLTGRINSWAIQFSFFQFKNNRFTVYPIRTKISNQGFGPEATHTKNVNKYLNDNINSINLELINDLKPDFELINKYRKTYKLGFFTKMKNFFLLT